MPAGRAAAVGGCFLGLGVAAPLLRGVRLRPAPGQIAGYARLAGFSPGQDVLRLAVVVAFALGGAAAAAAAQRSLRKRSSFGADRFSNPAPWLALALAPVLSLSGGGLPWTVLITAAAFAAAAAWADDWSRIARPSLVAAAILAQTLVAWAFVGGSPARAVPMVPLIALLLLFFTATAMGSAKRPPEAAIAAFAPSFLLLPVALWRTRPEWADTAAGAVALLLPCALALLPPRPERDRRLRKLLPLTLATSFAILIAATTLRYPPLADVFEDGHALLPASVYLSGGLPYRDVVPGHGLVSDGLLQAGELKLLGDDYRGLSRGNRLVGVSFWPLLFALGAAATGRAEIGFWSAGIALVVFPQYMFLRVMASLALLATAAFARRRTSSRPWFAAGVLLAISLLWAVEFAFYAAAALLAALAVSRGRRARHAAFAAAGAAAASAVVAAVFASLGILGAFVRTTFFSLPKLGAGYALGFPDLPPSMNPPLIPDSLASLGDPDAVYFWCLLFAVVAVALLVARPRPIGERGFALLPFLVWFLAATLSIIERRHYGYALFVAPAGIVLGARVLAGARGKWPRALGPLLVAWVVVVHHPIRTLGAISDGLFRRGAIGSDYAFPSRPPRLNGAAFLPADALAIDRAAAFVAGNLAPGETWLDFASLPALYYYLNRSCPIRYYEVGFYESPEAQAEVVRSMSANPRVRAVLVRFEGHGDIDGVPNRDRAPVVWEYVRRHFHPAFSADGVEFWLRNAP
jgi:hypothetical protein